MPKIAESKPASPDIYILVLNETKAKILYDILNNNEVEYCGNEFDEDFANEQANEVLHELIRQLSEYREN